MHKLVALIVSLLFASVGHAGDEVITTNPNDPQMLSAVTTAQDNLDDFLADYARHIGKATDYGVKVAFPLSGQKSAVEVIWVTYFDQIDADHFVGRLSNEPNYLPGLHLDSDVQFTRDMIQDWYILEDGKVYGYFTVRVLLPLMNEKTADEVRRSMHEMPLPARFE